MRVCPTGSSATVFMSTPMRRIRSGCCARHQRPRHRAAETRDESAPFHSITSSARAINLAGNSVPSALAAFKLTTNFNLVGRAREVRRGLLLSEFDRCKRRLDDTHREYSLRNSWGHQAAVNSRHG